MLLDLSLSSRACACADVCVCVCVCVCVWGGVCFAEEITRSGNVRSVSSSNPSKLVISTRKHLATLLPAVISSAHCASSNMNVKKMGVILS
jgi:hypothetical protein